MQHVHIFLSMPKFRFGIVLSSSSSSLVTFFLLTEKSEGKRQLGKPRRKWVDNIKMDLQEFGRRVVGTG
jgi:hypothetical protein